MDKRTFIKNSLYAAAAISLTPELLSCSTIKTQPKKQKNWVWVRPVSEWSVDDWKRKFDSFKAAGLDAVLAEVYNGNETFYEGGQLPMKSNVMEKLIIAGQASSVEIHAWMWTMPCNAILQMRTSRVSDTLSDIPTTEKELFIKVLDNAITDGDTISIIHNGKLIAERIQVAARAFPIRIQLSKENPYHELVLVAHNLGSTPPNTALLLVSSGGKEYRLHAFADLTKNALIIFRYIGQ